MIQPLVQPQQSLLSAQQVPAPSQAEVQSSVQYGPPVASQPQSQLAPQVSVPQQAPVEQQMRQPILSDGAYQEENLPDGAFQEDRAYATVVKAPQKLDDWVLELHSSFKST
ncbi:hypothetical protein PI125_g18276 [Phytophthora idaei]|nr:hypothetical protein PI125_g18276 [Phytophthora idaei]